MTENLLAGEEPVIDENKNYLEELVGDNKKFKDTEALAKGKLASDNYIKILETRLDALREDYMKVRDENVAGAKLQELIDKLDSQKQQLASREQNQNSNEGTQPVDMTQIESLVSAKIAQAQQSSVQAENYSQVESKLLERFGNNYKTTLKEQAKQLGLSDTEVNDMARNNPKLFYKTFDVESKQGQAFQAPPQSQRRNDSFVPRSQEKKTMSYYQDLRKKDPLAWHNPKIAVEMDKMAQELGDEFYDN